LGISKNNLVLFVTTGAYVGYFPRMPGTAATIVTIPLALALNRLADVSPGAALTLLVCAIAASIPLSTFAAGLLKQKDPQIIVIDEVVGFLLADFMCPPNWITLLLAFGLFRLFDITKIFPVNVMEKLPKGSGIVLDDVMAGLYTFLILHFFSLLGVL
jgi:phosphatidylglycerophosphatase A